MAAGVLSPEELTRYARQLGPGVLDAEGRNELTTLATRADAGDETARKEIDPILRNKARLRRMLTLETNPRVQRLARRMANGGC